MKEERRKKDGERGGEGEDRSGEGEEREGEWLCMVGRRLDQTATIFL